MKHKFTIYSLALTSFLVAGSFASPSLAASSEWVDLYGGKARLNAIKDPVTDVITGMIEIRLKKGWKTYWRKPGGGGIPPEFDFTGSTFFTLDKIQFPVPEIGDDADQFIGYHNSVNFFFSGSTTSVDATLELSLLAGLCEKLCIPATANFKIEAHALNQSDQKTVMSLTLNKNLLPREANEKFSLSNATHKDSIYTASAVIPFGLNDPILLVEGPNGWFSGIVKYNHDRGQFSFTLPKNLVTNTQLSEQFKYTLIASGQAVESTLPLNNISH